MLWENKDATHNVLHLILKTYMREQNYFVTKSKVRYEVKEHRQF